jgi:hypothetical protein
MRSRCLRIAPKPPRSLRVDRFKSIELRGPPVKQLQAFHISKTEQMAGAPDDQTFETTFFLLLLIMLCSRLQFSLPLLLPLAKCRQRRTRHHLPPSSLLVRRQDQALHRQITVICTPCRQFYYKMNEHSIWFCRLFLGRTRHITYWFLLFDRVPFLAHDRVKVPRE